MGKYKRIQNIPVESGSGYPQTEIDMEGIWVKGKRESGAKKIRRKEMRGYGAATKGKKFRDL